jgi:iron(II)-dependent oxidoreductase
MTDPAVLGPLSALHEMTAQLAASVPFADAARQYHPQLGSLSWLLGRSVYLETYWLREQVAGDDALTRRIAHLFTPGAMDLAAQCAALPPLDHLLNWAVQIREEHLLRLANPGMLPQHPLLAGDRLAWFLLQEQERDYERMLMVLNQRRLRQDDSEYRVRQPLRPSPLRPDLAEVSQGHYRVGARNDPAALDHELPPQAVELSGFRIARRPASNAEFLYFMRQDGYTERRWWSGEGWDWLQETGVGHPEYWRADARGNWYQVGINGGADLSPDEPVSGISLHEAKAFAACVSEQWEELAGAVLQHEYQWEIAARMGVLGERGRVQEWCANPFHPYPGFTPFPDANASEPCFDGTHASLRGASLHAQRPRRRLTCREPAAPERRYGRTGLRLVFPAGAPFWERNTHNS